MNHFVEDVDLFLCNWTQTAATGVLLYIYIQFPVYMCVSVLSIHQVQKSGDNVILLSEFTLPTYTIAICAYRNGIDWQLTTEINLIFDLFLRIQRKVYFGLAGTLSFTLNLSINLILTSIPYLKINTIINSPYKTKLEFKKLKINL